MKTQPLKIIVAVGENNEIGANGDLLWRLPKDMKWFKEKTLGSDVIMGRKTFESFPQKFRPLPNRTNILITRDKNYNAGNDVHVFHTIEDALDYALKCKDTQKFIIGGAEIYKQLLPQTAELYLTKVHATFANADTFFPEVNLEEWELVFEEKHSKDEKHQYDFTFYIYKRK